METREEELAQFKTTWAKIVDRTAEVAEFVLGIKEIDKDNLFPNYSRIIIALDFGPAVYIHLTSPEPALKVVEAIHKRFPESQIELYTASGARVLDPSDVTIGLRFDGLQTTVFLESDPDSIRTAEIQFKESLGDSIQEW